MPKQTVQVKPRELQGHKRDIKRFLTIGSMDICGRFFGMEMIVV